MSLINEALRKARQAASEHESKQPDGVFRPARAYPSRRSGRSGAPLAVAIIAVAAGAIGASAAWWLLSDRQTASTEPIISEARLIDGAAPVATLEASPTPVETDSGPRSGDAAADAVPTPLVVHTTESVAVDEADAEPARIESAPASTASKGPVVGPNGERVFVIEAELGYASLILGFIVDRSTNPFAEINGIEVYVGSEIEGFVVEAIEANRVTLRDDKGPLVLRVP